MKIVVYRLFMLRLRGLTLNCISCPRNTFQKNEIKYLDKIMEVIYHVFHKQEIHF